MNRKKIKIMALIFLLFASFGLFYYFSRGSIRRLADVGTSSQNLIDNRVSLEKSGASVNSNITRIKKIEALPKFRVHFSGREDDTMLNKSGKISLMNQNLLKLGDANFNYQRSGNELDWLSFSNIEDIRVLYKAQISFDGYLPSLVSVDLSKGGEYDLTLAPGDVVRSGQRQRIDEADLSAWKNEYGKPLTQSNSFYDFNGDGRIDYLDFAISFGSPNYGKEENID